MTAWLLANAAWAALGLAALFGVLGPAVARRTTPVAATWLLSAGSVLAAGSALTVLALMSAPIVGQNEVLADRAHWSTTVLARDSLVGRGVAVAALVLLVCLLGRLVVTALREAATVHRAFQACRDLDATMPTELVVVPQDQADAYAVPGRPGRVVATQGLLRRLTPTERSAVLEHERSHLQHGHHWHLLMARVAVAANPLLMAVVPALGFATERWADEDAAAASDRSTIASALARVFMFTATPTPSSGPGLHAGAEAVPQRVAALLVEPPRLRAVLVVAAVLVISLMVFAALVATDHTVGVFELATDMGRHAARGLRCLSHASACRAR